MASIFNLGRVDLENATSKELVKALFDDDNTNQLNTAAIASIIERGEQEVLSWLTPEYGPPPLSSAVLAQIGADAFLKNAALEYAVAHMLDRHPEYVRSGAKDRGERFKRADQRMERILNARQRPPTVAQKPANVGGFFVDNGTRAYVDSADGTKNSGDY